MTNRQGTIARDPSPVELDRLLAAARAALSRSYAPYSRFRVAAALVDARGQLFSAANVENASYPLGVCAERAALLAWRAGSDEPLVAGVVLTSSPSIAPPCGVCRDALLLWAPAARFWLGSSRSLRGPGPAGAWLPAGGTR